MIYAIFISICLSLTILLTLFFFFLRLWTFIHVGAVVGEQPKQATKGTVGWILPELFRDPIRDLRFLVIVDYGGRGGRGGLSRIFFFFGWVFGWVFGMVC